MIVYHESCEIVEKPDVMHSFRPLDFGKGFYVTTIKEQAERWAKRKADLFGKKQAVISVYQMQEEYGALTVKNRLKSSTYKLFFKRTDQKNWELSTRKKSKRRSRKPLL